MLQSLFIAAASVLAFMRPNRSAPVPSEDDAAQVRAALAGDRAAVRALVERLTPAIRARVLRLTRGAGAPGGHAVEDLVSEVWARLLANDAQRLRAYDPSRGKTLEGYVSLIAGQLVVTLVRAARAEKRGSGRAEEPLDAAEHVAAVSPDPEQSLVAASGEGLFAHLEANLSDRGRLVLRLVYVDGLSVADAATALGVTAQVIYNWQFKIRGLAEAWRASEGRDARTSAAVGGTP